MSLFSGHYAPLLTPFTDDGSTVSEIRLARLIRWLSENGIEGFVAGTDTGEFGACSFGERKSILEMVVRSANGKPVLAHVSSLSTSASLDLAQHAGRHGARAVVMMPPYYGSFTEDEIFSHFHAVVQHSSLPVIVVDPTSAIKPPLQGRLLDLPQLKMGKPVGPTKNLAFRGGCWSDEFEVDELVVSPILALAPKALSGGVQGNILPAGQALGGARAGKLWLQRHNLEMGPLRGPLRMPSTALEQALTTILGAFA